MSQPTDDEDPELERERLIEDQNRPILDQLDRMEETLGVVAETLAPDTDGPVT
jgi:hypothetical protein